MNIKIGDKIWISYGLQPCQVEVIGIYAKGKIIECRMSLISAKLNLISKFFFLHMTLVEHIDEFNKRIIK